MFFPLSPKNSLRIEDGKKEFTNNCVFRRGIGTELGSKAANRLDSFQGMLKDPPKKLGLRGHDVGMDEEYGGGLHGIISGTNTTPYNLLSVPGRGEWGGGGGSGDHCVGFQPGPFTDRSLRNSVNVIPLKESKDSDSTNFHSQPFR